MEQKELEDKLNEIIIERDSLKEKLKNTEDELNWVSGKYNELLNGTFTEMFDIVAELFSLCGKVKDSALFKILEKRNQPSE